MSKKCRAYSASKLGLEPADNRKAFYAGWDAAIEQAEKQGPVAIKQGWDVDTLLDKPAAPAQSKNIKEKNT